MKIKFDNKTGKITGFGYVKTLTPSADETEMDYPKEAPLDFKESYRVDVRTLSVVERSADEIAEEKSEIVKKKQAVAAKLGLSGEELETLALVLRTGLN